EISASFPARGSRHFVTLTCVHVSGRPPHYNKGGPASRASLLRRKPGTKSRKGKNERDVGCPGTPPVCRPHAAGRPRRLLRGRERTSAFCRLARVEVGNSVSTSLKLSRAAIMTQSASLRMDYYAMRGCTTNRLPEVLSPCSPLIVRSA